MPSPETVNKALKQIRKRKANHDYFFSKLESPDWLQPLDDAGLFSEAPPVVRDGEWISFPIWPESQYLARIASKAPEQVAAVMMKLPDTENVRVHQDLAKAALDLPGGLAAKWALKEATWVRKKDHLYFLLPEELGQLIVHLSTTGEAKASLALARAVLSLKKLVGNARRPEARFREWDYRHILQKDFPVVLRNSPHEAMELLCDLLEVATAVEGDPNEDYSYFWRPAIEPHTQNFGYGDLRDVLIDAVRDGAEQLISEGKDVEAVIQTFLNREKPVFRRLALHLAAGNHREPIAKKLACEWKNFADPRLWHEYNRLLRSVFSDLNTRAQNSVLGWIEKGPSDDDGEEATELRRQQKTHWQATRLVGLRGKLPEEWEQYCSELVEEVGEPENPDFSVYRSGIRFGSVSPKEVHELDAMSVVEIASFLKAWEPSDEWEGPTREGLASTLQKAVGKSPEKFILSLDAFIGVVPDYACTIVRGLVDAAKDGKMLAWKQVIDYLYWISQQPRDAVADAKDLDHDNSRWGWARKEATELLSIGFEKRLIDFSLRDLAWHVVERIVDDPDPTAKDDARSTMDPTTRSINTVRGEALHTVIRYALWVRQAAVGSETDGPTSFSMKDVPEVEGTLERHLDPEIDPSPAIRAVYGQWIPWLQLIDNEWAEAHLDSIFPTDNPTLRDAAWHAYLAYCPIYNETFALLQSQYTTSVDRLQQKTKPDSDRDIQEGQRIGEHLMVMFGQGKVGWNNEDGLVKHFFERASVSDASNAVAFVGQSLDDECRTDDKNPVPNEVLARFRSLWDDLKESIDQDTAERKSLLEPFGWWLICGRFDVEWALQEAKWVIEISGSIDPDFLVLKELENLSEDHPIQSFKVLRSFARSDQLRTNLFICTSSIRAVLAAALNVPQINADAKDFIHELGACGHFGFRDLLRSS